MILRLSPARVRLALTAFPNHARTDLLRIFAQSKYVSASIDIVTIKSRNFLNINVVNGISDSLPDSSDFDQRNSFTTPILVDIFVEILTQMPSEGVICAGMRSDGWAFQKKSLSWCDPESIQSRGVELSKLLLVPCSCHRLQNSMVELFPENVGSKELIVAALDIAVFLHKPGLRARIGESVPGTARFDGSPIISWSHSRAVNLTR
jgi:hypothetical protein